MTLNTARAIEVTRRVDASAETVWAVLGDGWLYATWVVGASRVRDVEAEWPQPGARIHHSVGLWPALINDTTSVRESHRPDVLELTARGWPLGEAQVLIRVEAAEGDPDGCVVTMVEDAVAGPGRLVPMAVRQALILPRNRESLARLAFLAEGGARTPVTAR